MNFNPDDILDPLAEECVRQPLVNETVNLKPIFKIETINKKDDYCFDVNAEEVAAERGQIVVYPQPNQLQLDIDSDAEMKEFYARCDALGLFFVPVEAPASVTDNEDTIDLRPSRTAGHFHVYLTFHDRTFTEETRLLWQSMLGSDPAREFLNFRRLLFGIERPSRMFEKDPKTDEQYEAERLAALVNENP